MAIDSAEKRKSIVGLFFLFGASVTPNSSKDAEWRQEVGYSYPGIAAGAAAAIVGGISRISGIRSHIGISKTGGISGSRIDGTS